MTEKYEDKKYEDSFMFEGTASVFLPLLDALLRLVGPNDLVKAEISLRFKGRDK